MIVVESGGTKSTWVFHDISGQQKSITTVGLHPQELSNSKLKVISDLIEVEQLQGSSVYFFGAGCESNEAKNKVIRFLEKFSLLVQQVETDIYAACVAHLGDTEGVVGVLGTGAVAAHFDGHKNERQPLLSPEPLQHPRYRLNGLHKLHKYLFPLVEQAARIFLKNG